MKCKICKGDTYILFDEQFKMDYHRCKACGFIYADPKHHATLEDEKEEYNRHNNSIEDEGYVNMFKRFMTAFEPFVSGKVLLEYGSGPEPVFSEVLRRQGYEVTSYDPFYLPDEAYLNKKYDIITSTEVFEHFSEPYKEFEKLDGLLKEEGIMAIMTQFPKDDDHFKKWWYRRDITHISFFTVESFKSLAKDFHYELMYHNEKDYMILKKSKKH
ncbi:class I SAM-dependent methyltransferase [Acidaminobacter sp. JC074]|uniref:class I SAM-dependent methyltransferase n=1 Tax=Acidaminobacter sp. JC074 TaxID=2530199 RepID=UPI001F0FB4AF|nr:class I SAM-dependent methyltransferase [Acidaminobacter sp. JC074]MCH4890726.1 class I SAM-dependent methyltransferase [Acidaminobacter sp. JC074]